MQSTLQLLILLLVSVLIVVPILAMVAFVRTSSLQKYINQIPQLTARIYELEQRLRALDHRIGAPAGGAREETSERTDQSQAPPLAVSLQFPQAPVPDAPRET